MRIIGGEARGRVLRLPAGSGIRPTADRVKESLFNILLSVGGCSFLDLFAGSGSVGLEALSRGAGFVAFVEKDLRLVRSLEGCVDHLGFTARAEVIAADAERGVGRLVQRGHRFDIIFMDPPYDRGLVWPALLWPGMRKALAEDGTIVLQHSAREKPAELQAQSWMVADQRRYGDTVLSFLQKSVADTNDLGTDFESLPKGIEPAPDKNAKHGNER